MFKKIKRFFCKHENTITRKIFRTDKGLLTFVICKDCGQIIDAYTEIEKGEIISSK